MHYICCPYMVALLIKFSEQQVAALRALAEKTGLSVSEHIRRAIDLYLSYLKGEE